MDVNFYIYILVSIIVFIFLCFLFLIFILKKQKEKVSLRRGMNLVLFLVSIPQETKEDNERRISLEEHLKIAEHFYSSLQSFKEGGFISKRLWGDIFFVFEIAVHRIGEEIYFYVACPRKFSQLMEKQILGFWPKAQVQEIEDYNIFNPSGSSLGSVAYLERESILPIKTYKDFGIDPLSTITNVFTKLEKDGEGAAIQLLVRPTRKKIKKWGNKTIENMQKGMKLENAIIKAKRGFLMEMIGTLIASGKKDENQKLSVGDEKTPIQQEIVSSISQKISQPLFDVNLRVLSSAKDNLRSQMILNQIEAAFEQFNSPLLNAIKFRKLSGRKLKKLFYYFSFRIFNDKETMVFSSGELAGLFHFPDSHLLTPHIKWLKAKQAPPPVNLPEDGIIIGKSVFRAEERIVRILKNDRGRHFYIIGQTGTGKSVLLQEMIRQDIEAGEGVALIDPHGDLAEKVLALIPPSRAEDVIYFNPGDVEKPLGLNMLEYDPLFPESKTFVVNELLEIFEKLYNLKAHGFGGPIFEQYMRNALLLVMEDPESGNTLIEVPKVLADANFRKYKLSKCKNIVVKNFWEMEAEKAGGEAALANMVPYITSKMNIFIANDLVRPIIGQQKSSFNLREIMDSGKILIVNLAKGRLGDINSYLLGMIIIGKILIAAFSRANIPEEERKDFYLYIDEFHNVTTNTITAVLAEARKYHLAMIFGHQFIGQLDEDTRKAIFGNVGSIMAFRVGPEDAKYLVTQFEPTFDENDLVNFNNYNAALRLLINGETSKPFNIITFPPSKGDTETAQLIKELSRIKYGRNKNVVENEIYERLKQSYFI
jgi:hypothetical protein